MLWCRAQPHKSPLSQANKWLNNSKGTLQHQFLNGFSSRLAFPVQLCLQSLYAASIMYHPLKEKRKAVKTQAISEKEHPQAKQLLEGCCTSPRSDLRAKQLVQEDGKVLPVVLR